MRWIKENVAAAVSWGHDGDNKDILEHDTAAHFQVSLQDYNLVFAQKMLSSSMQTQYFI